MMHWLEGASQGQPPGQLTHSVCIALASWGVKPTGQEAWERGQGWAAPVQVAFCT